MIEYVAKFDGTAAEWMPNAVRVRPRRAGYREQLDAQTNAIDNQAN